MMRLDAESAWFRYLEQPEHPMVIMAVAVLGPGPAITPEELRAHMLRRLAQIPAFRLRVVDVPFGLHHPVCVEDPDFDIYHHLRRVCLPDPDGLERFCSALTERHLDPGRPLWQLTLVDGLGDSRQALVLRVHHCLMDGHGMANTLARIFSTDAEITGTSWMPESMPRRKRLIGDAGHDYWRSLGRLPALAWKTRSKVSASRAHSRQSTVAVPTPGTDSPWCSLHGARAFRRSFTQLELPLADVLQVKNAAGATVNDVVLAIVGGALRSFLLARDDLPRRPLVAYVPVGLDPPGASTRVFGNRISAIATTLATDIEDPWQRLATTRATTVESKYRLGLQGPELLLEWLEYFPPFVGEVVRRLERRKRRARPGEVAVNTVISNIRGPARPWSLGWVPVDEVYIAGPMTGGAGVDVMVLDYGDRLLLSIMSFVEAVDDPAELADAMRAALSELVEVATRERIPTRV